MTASDRAASSTRNGSTFGARVTTKSDFSWSSTLDREQLATAAATSAPRASTTDSSVKSARNLSTSLLRAPSSAFLK